MPRHPPSINSANGIRTRVWALRGPRPSPLDDSAKDYCELLTNCELSCYRPGGNRTPNRRFWRPVLYQLSYGPIPVDCEPLRTAENRSSVLHSTFVRSGVADGN